MDRKPSTHRIPCFNRQVQTFDTFQSDSSNRLARSMLYAATQMPLESYNPLYVYGRSGSGKTHLLNAAAHMRRETRPYGVRQIVCDPANFEPMLQELVDFDLVLIDQFEQLAGECGLFAASSHLLLEAARTGVQVVVASRVKYEAMHWDCGCAHVLFHTRLAAQVSLETDEVDLWD